MYPINFSEHAKLLNSTVLGIVPVRCVVTIRRRNAWHGSESIQYRGNAALARNLAFAKLDAEDWRQNGSHFAIWEVPALAILSSEGELVCVDLHRRDPFVNFDIDVLLARIRIGETTVAEYAQLFSSAGAWKITPDDDSILQAAETAHGPAVLDGEEEFAQYVSQAPRDRGADMDWMRLPRANVQSTSVRRISTAILEAAGVEQKELLIRYEHLKDERMYRHLVEFSLEIRQDD